MRLWADSDTSRSIDEADRPSTATLTVVYSSGQTPTTRLTRNRVGWAAALTRVARREASAKVVLENTFAKYGERPDAVRTS